MEDYDLVLTPRWCWHDHHNSTENHVTWFDTLDIGLINLLNVNVYEPYGDERQPQRPNHADYVSQRTGLLRPVWEERPAASTADALPVARRRGQADGDGGCLREPVRRSGPRVREPDDGRVDAPDHHLLAPAACPGSGTKAHRHSSSSTNFVVRGQGRAIVDDTELSWSRHDAFAIPNWAWHHLINDSAR